MPGEALSEQDRVSIREAFTHPTVGTNMVALMEGAAKKVDKIISTAEVLDLYDTPITVLPAVGTGIYPQFLGAFLLLDYNSKAYVDGAGEDVVFQQLSGGSVVSQSIDGAELDGTADALLWFEPSKADACETHTLVDNGGFEVAIQTADWATGDSSFKIRLFYRLIKKSTMEAIA